MKQASIPLYIRFGDIPKDENSAVHFSDAIIRNEGGVSVWKAVEANGQYYPILPEDANESAISDLYGMLLRNNKPIYLVTGNEMRLEGADREPLLQDVIVIKELKYYEMMAKMEMEE